MSKWKYRPDVDDTDKLEKFAKIRRSKISRKVSDQVKDFELDESEWPVAADEGYFRARVVEVHKRYAFISVESLIHQIDTKDVWLATVARKFLTTQRGERNFICVGDRVLCKPAREEEKFTKDDLPQCSIIHRTPRHSHVARIDPGNVERQHILACNVEQALIVASFLAPKVRWGLIDRCLVMAESEGIEPIIILNKRDLLKVHDDKNFVKECEQHIEDYRRMGYAVFTLKLYEPTARDIREVGHVKARLDNKISMVVGHSGVGKSSLINLFKPEIEQMVEPDADIFYKGRHTTTYASLIRLGSGGYMVDTPGVRSFAIKALDAINLTHCFRDFRPYLGRCKFRECRHVDEPQCAVLQAVEAGEIAAWRYRSFQGILSGDTGREGRTRELDLEDEPESTGEE